MLPHRFVDQELLSAPKRARRAGQHDIRGSAVQCPQRQRQTEARVASDEDVFFLRMKQCVCWMEMTCHASPMFIRDFHHDLSLRGPGRKYISGWQQQLVSRIEVLDYAPCAFLLT